MGKTVIDTSYIRKEFKAIMASSQWVKKLVKEAMKDIQTDPACYRKLQDDDPLAGVPGACLRAVDIIHQVHDYRLVYLHHSPSGEGVQYATFVFAGKRRDGYEIDWDWIKSMLAEE